MASLASYWQTSGKKYIDWLSRVPLKTIRNTLCFILAIWVLFSIVRIVQVFIPLNQVNDGLSATDSADVSSLGNSVQKSTVNIAKLQSLNLFGKTGEPILIPKNQLLVPDAVELQATKTRLNLSLEGIVTASQQGDALAFIVYQGKQDQYYIGDKLPVASKVSLVRVKSDHVILDNAGRYESLWLYDKEKSGTVNKSTAAGSKVKGLSDKQNNKYNRKVTDKRSNKVVTSMAADYRQRLYKNPRSLAQALRISPIQKNGQLIGYKVKPGKDMQQFTDLGFLPNDIVTSINGISLDEPSKALEIYKLMRTATQASFTVDRDGSSEEIMVSLGDNS